MAGKGSSRDASGADNAGTDWHGKSLKLRQEECLRVAHVASRLDQERKPQNVYRNYGFRVDSETAGFLNGYTPARFETGIIENGTPTTERIVPPKTGLPSMNTDLLARYGMNVLPAPIRFVRLSTSGRLETV